MKKGMQELSTHGQLGDFLQETPEGVPMILRGKFRGATLDKVPRGYIREYILKTWDADMNPEEKKIFQKYATKEKPMPDENQTKPPHPETPEEETDHEEDTIQEAFETAERTGRAEISLKDVLKKAEKRIEAIKHEATDDELKESEEVIKQMEDTSQPS